MGLHYSESFLTSSIRYPLRRFCKQGGLERGGRSFEYSIFEYEYFCKFVKNHACCSTLNDINPASSNLVRKDTNRSLSPGTCCIFEFRQVAVRSFFFPCNSHGCFSSSRDNEINSMHQNLALSIHFNIKASRWS